MKRLLIVLLTIAAFILSPLEGASPITIKVLPKVCASDFYARIVSKIERDPANWDLYLTLDGDTGYYRQSLIQLHDTAYLTQNVWDIKSVPCGNYTVQGELIRKVDGKEQRFVVQDEILTSPFSP